MTIGTVPAARILRHTSKPSMPGSMRSSTTSSAASCACRRRPSSPVAAATTSCPYRSSAVARPTRTAWSSSISRMRDMAPVSRSRRHRTTPPVVLRHDCDTVTTARRPGRPSVAAHDTTTDTRPTAPRRPRPAADPARRRGRLRGHRHRPHRPRRRRTKGALPDVRRRPGGRDRRDPRPPARARRQGRLLRARPEPGPAHRPRPPCRRRGARAGQPHLGPREPHPSRHRRPRPPARTDRGPAAQPRLREPLRPPALRCHRRHRGRRPRRPRRRAGALDRRPRRLVPSRRRRHRRAAAHGAPRRRRPAARRRRRPHPDRRRAPPGPPAAGRRRLDLRDRAGVLTVDAALIARTRPTAHGAGPREHLPALDGLRGIAIAGVLLFHAGHLGGGFLGVDLFLALSGYLITDLLLREVAATRTVSLTAFWARRARRLLPAL